MDVGNSFPSGYMLALTPTSAFPVNIAPGARARSVPAPSGTPLPFSPPWIRLPRNSKPSIVPSRLTRPDAVRSEEHTSELQSRLHLVCRLLLEKKKKKTHT